MDEQSIPAPVAPDVHPAEAGGDRVQAVLRSVEGLDDRPLEEHVAVFEAAHDSLRRALAGDGARG
ncbi:hypothetical protein [Nocardioides aurantiacus]|uniref:Uncharacterized protein n=1 Tax=Nocardioides aurantiacus TaxID=86796 RepID=A0A3N2CUH2_9ACTN|nr:hypothetical protein [Nocardioides aurantiacus]ROR91183.1 hypothetical protein EDD33_2046 [Nocardioides aurantiacus]